MVREIAAGSLVGKNKKLNLGGLLLGGGWDTSLRDHSILISHHNCFCSCMDAVLVLLILITCLSKTTGLEFSLLFPHTYEKFVANSSSLRKLDVQRVYLFSSKMIKIMIAAKHVHTLRTQDPPPSQTRITQVFTCNHNYHSSYFYPMGSPLKF